MRTINLTEKDLEIFIKMADRRIKDDYLASDENGFIMIDGGTLLEEWDYTDYIKKLLYDFSKERNILFLIDGKELTNPF